jgi:ATP-binding cassette subfamily B multidrug efflux pump
MSASPASTPQKTARPKGDKLRAYHEEAASKEGLDWSLLKRMWPFVAPHAKLVVFSLVGLLVITGVGLARPMVLAAIVEDAGASDGSALFRHGLLMAFLLVVAQTLGFVQVYTMQLAGAGAMGDLRRAVFLRMQRLSLRYVDGTPIGRLVTRATNDVDALGELFASGALNAVGDLVSLVGIVVAMLVLDWRMALFAFAALPPVALLVNVVRRKSREAYRSIRTRTARMNAYLNEQVLGMAVVQAFAREEAAEAEFDEINRTYRDANKAAVFWEALLDAAIEMVASVCVGAVLWWAGVGHLGVGAEVPFAVVVAFAQYLKQFFEPVSQIASRYTLLQSALSGAERVFEFLDVDDLEPAGAGEVVRPAAEGVAVRFENVEFAYKPESPVLRGVNFEVRAGEHVALVGATGAGKTTVLSLLLRLYELTGGRIELFGTDIARVAPGDLREHFAVVTQDVVLFPGTVAENVALGASGFDREAVREALRVVGLLASVEGRPGGIDAVIEERGANFSAGERQLLAFARAIFRRSPFVLLDEATANVDSDTEAKLKRASDELLRGRTSLVIAHRLSTIQNADRILVFHRGRIAESGTHAELLARGGLYARLHRLQFEEQSGIVAS